MRILSKILTLSHLQWWFKVFVYVMLFIEGASLMTVELMGAKLLAPFFGSSLYVWATALSITVLGLAIGYTIGGRLSVNSIASICLLPVVFIAALWTYLLPSIANLAISITSTMPLLPGIVLTSLMLLVLPMICFGLVGPLAVELLSSGTKKVNNVAGNVYFISTLGGVAATFFIGFYSLPEIGMINTSRMISLVLFSIPVVHVLLVNVTQHREPFTITETLAIPTEKSKGNTAAKVNRFIYIYVVLEGGAVMAVELIAARMLAPYFGASLYVWSAIIGVTLFSLAMGYFAGGKIAEKRIELNTIHWVLLGASLFMLCMHFLSGYLTNALQVLELQTALILVIICLIVPPLTLLGMLPTLVIRYFKKVGIDEAQITGRIFTVSSLSGIVALFLLGFYIIPHYGLTTPSIAIGILIGVIPFVRLIFQQKYLSAVFLLFLGVSLSQRNKAVASTDVKVLHFSEGILGQVIVADVLKNSRGEVSNDRMLFMNRIGQSQIDNRNGQSNWNYITFSSSVASILPERSTSLLLGLGGGSVANMLNQKLKLKVDAVELDERIAKIATKYFALSKEVNVVTDDARHFLETTDRKYDLIFFDVFKGDLPPPHVLSKECFTRAKSLLTNDGFIILNFNGFLSEKIGKPGRSVMRTLEAAGFQVKVLATPGEETKRNTLFVATTQTKSFAKVRSPLFYKGNAVNMDTLFMDPKTLEMESSSVYTDDQSCLEAENIEAANVWRSVYNQTYTKFFTEKGIPMFK